MENAPMFVSFRSIIHLAAVLAIPAMLAVVGVIIYFATRRKRVSAPPVIPQTERLPRRCPQCGSALQPDVPEGLCPACLLQHGIATEGGVPPGQPPFTPPTLAELARLFPQLEVIELIGKGGMGAVYKARQPALDRFVALKILAPRGGSDLDFASRFSREARALAKLSHPNIVGVYDFGVVSGVSPDATQISYFIMEYVDGPNLRQVQQAGRLAPREALEIIPQICAALQFAHDAGIVHRDIKPENVLLDKKGRVKIADFGLAKILGSEAQDFRLTGTRDVMGTPHYMAPEQVERPQEVDHRADIYSLGVVFYEMLTGELPLGRFPAPSRKVQVDIRLDDIVLRALEKEPGLRYQQASVFKTEVETVAKSGGEQIRGGAVPPTYTAPPPTRSNKVWIVIAALALLPLLAIVAAVALVGFSRHQARRENMAHRDRAVAEMESLKGATIVARYRSDMENRIAAELSRVSIRFDRLDVVSPENDRFVVKFTNLRELVGRDGTNAWENIEGSLIADRIAGDEWDFQGDGRLSLVHFTLARLPSGTLTTGVPPLENPAPVPPVAAPQFQEYSVNRTWADLAEPFDLSKPETALPSTMLWIVDGTDDANAFNRGMLDMTLPPGANIYIDSHDRNDVLQYQVVKVVLYRNDLAGVITRQQTTNTLPFVTTTLALRNGEWKVASADFLTNSLTEDEAATQFKANAERLWRTFKHFSGPKSQTASQPAQQPAQAMGELLGTMLGSVGQIQQTVTTQMLSQIPPMVRDIQRAAENLDRELIPATGAIEDSQLNNGPSDSLAFRWVARDSENSQPADELLDPSDSSRHRKLRVLKAVLLDDSAVDSAASSTDARGGKEISVVFTDEGRRRFAELTTHNVGRQLAITWGPRLLTAPIIRSQINSPSATISGNFSEADCMKIVAALNQNRGRIRVPRENIERLIRGAPVRTGYMFEVWGKVPGTSGEYRVRKGVKRIPLLASQERGSANLLRGEVFCLTATNRFYVQWDPSGGNKLHYYGPFQGDPEAVLNTAPPSPEEIARDLNARYEAAKDITAFTEKDLAMSAVARNAAAAGNAEIAKKALGEITAFTTRDDATRQAALELAANGHRAEALEIAKSITAFTTRDETLRELAK